MKNIFTLFVLWFSISSINVSAQQIIKSYNFNPGVFIENKGQIVDEYGYHNNAIQFLYHSGLFNLELRRDGFSYEIFEVQRDDNNFFESGKHNDDESEP